MVVSELGGRERSVILGRYLVEHQTTVRHAAEVFGVSKSTVHRKQNSIRQKLGL